MGWGGGFILKEEPDRNCGISVTYFKCRRGSLTTGAFLKCSNTDVFKNVLRIVMLLHRNSVTQR